MWCTRKFKRKFLSIAVIGSVLIGVSACGFKPLYQRGGGGDEKSLSEIEVEVIKDRIGQQLRNLLIARLSPHGLAKQTAYRLTIELSESRQSLAFKKDDTATRANLIVRAKFTLLAKQRPTSVGFSGEVVSTISYNILASDFATLSAEADARKRALTIISEDIRIRLAAALRNPKMFERKADRSSK